MRAVPALLRVLTRYWKRHRVQAFLSLVGIAVGVAVFSAIRVTNRSALDSFAQGVTALAGRATHRVYSPAAGGVPDGLFPLLAAAPAVEAATPYLTGTARVDTPGGELSIVVAGFDLFTEPPFGRISLVPETRQQPPTGGPPALERFLGEAGAVMLPRRLARRMGVAAGGRFQATVLEQPRTLTAVGIFAPPPGREHAFANTAITDISTHQELFGSLGRVDAIHLIVRAGREGEIAALLPGGIKLEAIGRRGERIAAMAEAFQFNLEALGLFALLVATFVIFNAASFSVLQRRSALALLRSLGAPRSAIFFALLLEGVVLGAAGGALGVAAGQGLAAVMVAVTSDTLSQVVLGGEAVSIGLGWYGSALGSGVLLGIGFALLGMLWPAIEGSRVSPMAAIRQAARSVTTLRQPILWGLVGAGLLGLAAALSLPAWRSLGLGFVAATALATGFALLCPLALAGVSRGLSRPLGALLGPAGRMAGRNLARSLARSGLATGSLMVALSLALSIDITVRSFRRTFDVWMTQTVNADIYLAPPAPGLAFPAPLLPALAAQPWVRNVSILRTRRVTLGERQILVLALQPEKLAHTTRVPVVQGSQEGAVESLRQGRVWVSEALASHLGLGMGDTVAIPTSEGPRRVEIGAVVRNFSYPAGVLYLGQEPYRRWYGPQPHFQVELRLRDGISTREAMAAIETLPGGQDVRMTPNADIRAEAGRVFDRTFNITDLMGSLAALAAFLAVVSALTAMLEERTRVMGYLRAVGLSRGMLAGSLVVESLLLAGTATVISWGAGPAMAWVLVFVINKRAFGWSLEFHPGQGEYATLAAIAIGAALLGSIYPIFQATRRSVAATIREE